MAANSRFAMATHIVAALAINEKNHNTSSSLAKSLNTNPVVVRRILGELQRGGLIKTTAGRTGGVILVKKPAAISLYDIYTAIGGNELFAYNPNDPNKACPVSCSMKSVLYPVFEAAGQALSTNLKKVRLSDLVRQVLKT
jgi:Rrf2 family protein